MEWDMPLVLEHVERKVTAMWMLQFAVVAVSVFSPVHVLVGMGESIRLVHC